MNKLLLGLALGAAIGAVAAERIDHATRPGGLAYVSAAEVASALRQIGAANGDRPVVRLDPYVVLAEHRAATQNPATKASIHKDEAELYYVIGGSATLVTGRLPEQSSGGITQQIHAGDVLIIPENTPHWFSGVERELSYVSMHMPRSSSSSGN
jgi:mannose-6-phosphate isomerase-like protein (cupin superfamily)